MENVVSKRIKEERKAKKMSIRELSEEIGINHSTLARYEKGDIKKLPIENFKKIANSLNVSPVYLLGYTDDKHYTIKGNNNTLIAGDNNGVTGVSGGSVTINNNASIVETENTLDDSVENQKSSIKLQEDDGIVQNKMLEVLIDISKGINTNLEISRDILTRMNNNVVDFKQHYLDKNNKYVDLKLYGSVSAGTGLELFDDVVETIQYPEPVPTHDIALKVNGDSMSPVIDDGEIVFIKKTTNISHGQIGAFILNGEGYLKKFIRTKEGIKLKSLNKKYEDIIITENDDIKLVGIVVL